MASPRWTTMSDLPTEFAHRPSDKSLQQLIELHAPIIVQPSVDVKNGNGLLAAFYHVIRKCTQSTNQSNNECDHISCVKSVILSVVYESEATYSAHDQHSIEPSVNHVGTFCYRSHNYRMYHRTADINHLALHGFEFNQSANTSINDHADTSTNNHTDSSISNHINSSINNQSTDLISNSAYDSIHSTDFGGLQRWCRGDKFTLMCYSFMSHKDATIKRAACRSVRWPISDADLRDQVDEWAIVDQQMHEQDLSESQRLDQMVHANSTTLKSSSDRVVLYVTTSNHLMSPFDTNIRKSSAHQTIHSRYPLFVGDRNLAERFCQSVIADKWTIWSLLPRFMDPRPTKLRKARKAWKHLHQHAVNDNATPQSIVRDSVIQVDEADHSRIVTSQGVVIADMQQYEE